MIIILKIILGLMVVASGLVFRSVIQDFSKVKKNEGYDNLSIWEKIKFTSVFFFIFTALVSLVIFLIYFIIVPIQIV